MQIVFDYESIISYSRFSPGFLVVSSTEKQGNIENKTKKKLISFITYFNITISTKKIYKFGNVLLGRPQVELPPADSDSRKRGFK